MVVFSLVVSGRRRIVVWGMVMGRMGVKVGRGRWVGGKVVKKISGIEKGGEEDGKCEEKGLFENGKLLVDLEL